MNIRKPVALVLGGTTPHVALIEHLKLRGYYTVLVDYHENPPAKRLADEHIRASTLDQAVVLAIAKSKGAQLVISACIDQANVTACFVAEQMGLPHPYSYETALNTSDKTRMKQIMAAKGIPTARFVIITLPDQAHSHGLPYPVIVKPADSNGSKGVRRVDRPDDLFEAVSDAFSITRCGRIIIEEFCKGDEISVDCYVAGGKTHTIMMRRKYNMIDASGAVIQCYASVAPAVVGSNLAARIDGICESIAINFNITTSSLLVQLMVNNDDINVIEFAPRVGGGLSYRTVHLNTGFDILDATINSYFGIESAVNYHPPLRLYAANNVYAKPGYFGEIRGFSNLLTDGIISDYFQHKTRGMTVGAEMASKDRIASFIVTADNSDDLLLRIRTAMEKIEAYDPDGRSILRHDIYLKKL